MNDPTKESENDDAIIQNYIEGAELGQRMIIMSEARGKIIKKNISSLFPIQNAPGPRITHPLPEDFDPYPEFPEYKLKYTRKELCDMFWDDYGGVPDASSSEDDDEKDEEEEDETVLYLSWDIFDWNQNYQQRPPDTDFRGDLDS